HDDTIEDGRPRVRMVRSFAVLPAREGRLRIDGPRLRWWDVDADRMREATLPPPELDVAPATSGAGMVATRGDDGLVRVPGVQQGVGAWALAAVAFALLWLLTLAWALQWRQRATTADGPQAGEAGTSGARGHGASARRPW